MTHTITEQPWWRAHTDEIERKVACGEMNAATCFTKMLWLVSEASQAQRVPLSEVMNLVSEWGMASHANGEAALDAHSPDATPDEIAYADECVQSERAAWKAIEDKLRAHGITQELSLICQCSTM